MSEIENDRCPCGGIILADTEEWKTPLCDECYTRACRIDFLTRISRLEEKLRVAREALEGLTAAVRQQYEAGNIADKPLFYATTDDMDDLTPLEKAEERANQALAALEEIGEGEE